jgi:hypothetical protein
VDLADQEDSEDPVDLGDPADLEDQEDLVDLEVSAVEKTMMRTKMKRARNTCMSRRATYMGKTASTITVMIMLMITARKSRSQSSDISVARTSILNQC